MCGMNGMFALHGAAGEPKEDELISPRDAMRVRGPDGGGGVGTTGDVQQ